MAGIFRALTKQFIVTVNLSISICMLLLYLLPFSNQSYFWILNLFALVFPYLLIVQVFFLIFWLLVKPKLSLIPLVTLLLCVGLIRSLFGFHAPDQQPQPVGNSFRVASWNVHLFDFYENKGELDPKMLQKVREISADIFCAQEFVFFVDSHSNMSLENVKKRLGFRYVVAGNDRAFGVHTNINTKNERYFPFCVAIFSKYPIVKWKKLQTLKEYNHTFIWADIAIEQDTFRVFNIHLQSMHFAKNDYEFIENIDRQDVDEVKKQGRTIIRKIKNANFLRAIQVVEVKNEILKSPHPVILCGDFNDVPNSYSYQVIRQQLSDAFSEKGWGLGRTFQFLSPTLRLDYIFHGQEIRPAQFRLYDWDLSDHKPVMAVFERN